MAEGRREGGRWRQQWGCETTDWSNESLFTDTPPPLPWPWKEDEDEDEDAVRSARQIQAERALKEKGDEGQHQQARGPAGQPVSQPALLWGAVGDAAWWHGPPSRTPHLEGVMPFWDKTPRSLVEVQVQVQE